MDASAFRLKIKLICDPYFDREFFTNLIHCIDRKKTVREIFEAVMNEVAATPEFSPELDRALLHLFYSYQASSSVRENYQWLPLAQGIYALSLHRGDGEHQVNSEGWMDFVAQAATPEEFEALIRQEVRGVESMKTAWSSLLFLLENRTTRFRAAAAVVKESLRFSDPLSFSLITKGLDLALASGWRANGPLLFRAFERFWDKSHTSDSVSQGFRLAAATQLKEAGSDTVEWKPEWTSEIWNSVSGESAESGWSRFEKITQQGASFEQLFTLLTLLRGRCLFGMKTDQWPKVTSNLILSDALYATGRWVPDLKPTLLAISLIELVKIAQLTSQELPKRPSGKTILDGISKNISKDRLVLRLDDALERGDRAQALEIMAVILKDQGLTNSVSDRLVLVASKQDAWTYDMKTLPTASILTRTYDSAMRLHLKGAEISDALYGLLRFMSDQRENSLAVVPKTGTYGNGLPISQFDVSGGARNVDRFVFNQMRNSQRIRVWPSND